MSNASPAFSLKQARTIQHALTQLAGAKSYKPIRSIEDLKEVPFGRQLRLANYRMVLLSDYGMKQVEQIVNTTVTADPYLGLADYADVWSASWKTLEELLSNAQMAKDAEEWLSLISARLKPQIHSRRIVVPFVGVEFKDINDLVLGTFTLMRPSVRHLDVMGVDHGWADVPKIIAGYRDSELWLQGSVRGTPRVAESRFRILSDLVAGLLAVAAAVLPKSGATRIFISPNMTGHNSHGDATWFSWEEPSAKFTIHSSGIRGVPFVIDSNLREQLYQVSTIATAMRIFEAETRTPLEEAIARGFHWFADAHRDPTPVMQFVKYWSCIETFFSIDKEEITKSVSIGVAAVLVFGGYEFAPRDEYSNIKKRVTSLYKLRSKAVHQASRSHITKLDVAELSRYAAQLLINAVSFVERGYQRPDEIKRHSMRLDEQIEGGRGANTGNNG
jgi:Apea-like HEPN